MQLYIPNMKEIGPVVYETCVPEYYPILFSFFFFAPFTNITLSQPDTLLVDQFLLNLQ